MKIIKHRKSQFEYPCDYCDKILQFTKYRLNILKSHYCNRNCYLKELRKRQLQEYKNLKQKVKIDNNFQYWFAGFVDGEGTFATKLNEPNYPNGFVSFIVAQKAKPIIEKIKNTLKFGTIKTTNELWYYRVCGYAKCKIIYNLLKDKVKTRNKINQLKKWKCYFNYMNKLLGEKKC